MAVNHYFQSGIPGGRSSEQFLVEDLIIECLKIYGFDAFYMPRKTVNRDLILNEDPLNKYEHAYNLEMYLTNVQGFEGEGDLLSKFGVELRDTATFVVSKRRWEEVVSRKGQTQLSTRPAEGDIIYFPLTKSFFEIKKVDSQQPFFQLGKLYVFTLYCELLQFSSEEVNTGIDDIDDAIGDISLDVGGFELLLENGDKILLEYETPSRILLQSYNLSTIDPLSQNNSFETEIDILDFTDTNPFGEVYNS